MNRDPLGEAQFFSLNSSKMEKQAVDRLRIESLQPIYLFLSNDSVNDVDSLGLIPPGWWEKNQPPPPPPFNGPNPCEKYKDAFNTKCCRDGKTKNDPYPEKAHPVCKGFLKMYDWRKNETVRCVANCLVSAEKRIQNEYSSCSKRNSARLRAHVSCYASCMFVPVKGFPEGGSDVGVNMLLPDFIKNPLSLWDNCVSQ